MTAIALSTTSWTLVGQGPATLTPSGTVQVASSANMPQSLAVGMPITAATEFTSTLNLWALADSAGATVTVSVPGASGGSNPTTSVSQTPTITASSAYASGNEVGGLMTFAGAFDSNPSGELESIVITTKSAQTAAYQLYLFGTQPTNTSWADKTTPAIAAGDVPFLIGVWIVGVAASPSGVTVNQLDNINARVAGSSSTLYGVLVALGTPHYGSTSDLAVTIRIKPD